MFDLTLVYLFILLSRRIGDFTPPSAKARWRHEVTWGQGTSQRREPQHMDAVDANSGTLQGLEVSHPAEHPCRPACPAPVQLTMISWNHMLC